MNSKNKRVGFATRTVAIIAAVLIHAVLIYFLVANFNKPREAAVAKDADQIDTIMATTVSADEIKNQKKKIQKADAERKRKAEERRKQEQRELAKIKEEKEAETKKLEKAKEKRIEEEKAIALKRKKEKELKDKKEKERKRKEAEKKKRKAEELRKKKKADAARKKKEAEAAEKKRKEDRLKSLQDELSKELGNESSDERVANQPTGAQNTTTLFNKYVALIGDKVKANFNAPLGTPIGMEAVVNVRLDSAGRVKSTKVVQSSGNFSFDRAVEVAIARSAPLPMPPVSDPANARLQNINFPFRYRGS